MMRFVCALAVGGMVFSALSAFAGEIHYGGHVIHTTATAPLSLARQRALADGKGWTPVLIRFGGPIEAAWIAALEKLGIRVHQYVSEYAYVASVRPHHLNALRSMPGVEWVGALEPAYKIPPSLQKRGDVGKTRVVVLSLDDEPLSYLKERGTAVSSTSLAVGSWRDTRATLSADDLARLAELPSVLLVESEPTYKLYGEREAQTAAGNYAPGANAPWGPGYAAWLASHGLQGAPGLVVQVQDDGLDQGIATNAPGTAHPDILGRIAGIFNATSDLNGGGVAGHGQINAGIIMGNASVGLRDGAGYLLGQGMAPLARVYATKVFRNSGVFDPGGRSFAHLAADAKMAGAYFSNNSWGADVMGSYNADAAAFDALTRDANPAVPGHQPMVYFFAAGNAGPNSKTIGSPASAKNVIAVGAAENSDADGVDGCNIGPSQADSLRDIASFSSRGPAADGRLGITVVAVGTHVQGPASTAFGYDGTGVCDKFWPAGQTWYARSSGTSHAAPIACGAGMIVHELFQVLAAAGQNVPSRPSPAMIKAVLANTAADMAGGNNGRGGLTGPIPSLDQGWGHVNLSTLMSMRNGLYVFDQRHVFTGTGQSWETTIVPIDVSKPLKITLAWTDAPALPGSIPALVNDLDLVVSGVNTYLGNVFAGGMSTTGGAPNRRDNLECVYIANPSGSYTIRVRAHHIAGDGVPGVGGVLDQDFALFVWNGTDQSSAGAIRIAPSRVGCSGVVEVTVSDTDLRGAGTQLAQVSAHSGDSETLLLHEIVAGTGVLKGTLTLSNGGESPNDGVLRVIHGDIVTASYHDLDSGAGQPAVVMASAEVDCVPSVIRNVYIVTEALDSVRVEFTTDKLAAGSVVVGGQCGQVEASATTPVDTRHSVTLTKLRRCQHYYLMVAARDEVGNVGRDDNNGQCHRFTTLDFVGSEELFEEELSWQHGAFVGSDWWAVRPDGHARSGSQVVSYEPGPEEITDAYLQTPIFRGGGELSFWHRYEFEHDYDGAVIELSLDGGTEWIDLGPYIISGAYTGVLRNDFGNPLGGRSAWTGTVGGALREVRVDLSSFPLPVMVRFRFGADVSVMSGGWWIDDVRFGKTINCMDNFGRVILDRDIYRCGEVLKVQVRDANAGASQVQVVLMTDWGDIEDLWLSGNPATGFFYGQIPIVLSAYSGAQQFNNGQLECEWADNVLVEYPDYDDGTGVVRFIYADAAIDCSVPRISNIVIDNVDGDRARVRFTTSEICTGKITFGPACSLRFGAADSLYKTQHSVWLHGLASCLRYYVAIEATDLAGNAWLADNGGQCYQFTTYNRTDVISENFESGAAGWMHGAVIGQNNWDIRNSPAAHSPPHVMSFVPGLPTVGDAALVSPPFPGGGRLRFWHWYSLELGYDGAVVEIQTVPDGPWLDLGSSITQGGYTDVISYAYNSPLAGRMAWTGGNWMTSLVEIDLSGYAGMVRVRFRIASDESVGSGGWELDDVSITTFEDCQLPVPTPRCVCAGTALPGDADGDGVLDNLEFHPRLGQPSDGTNRYLWDSDGDGLSDGEELARGTQPRRRDSDQDGVGDGLELMLLGSDPSLASSPRNPVDRDQDGLPAIVDPNDMQPDTDGDRYADGFEAVACGLPAVVQAAVKPALGDVNCSMGATNLDALMIQSAFLGISAHQDITGIGNSDVNRDGFISNLDALVVSGWFISPSLLLPYPMK